MIKDTRYIIKRVIISILIIFIMTFIKSCTVHAETLSVNLDGFSTSGYTTRYSYFANTGSYTYYVSVHDAIQYSTMANDGYNNLLITACTNGRRGYDLYAFTNGKATSSYGSISDENFLTIMTNKPCSFSLGSTIYNGYTVYIYFYMNRSDLYTTNTSNYYMNRFTFTLYNHAFPDFGLMGQSAVISTEYPLILSQAIDEMKTQQLIDQNQTMINQNTNINNSINSVNDSINDSSTASNQDFNDAINSVKNSLPTNSTISSLITMPITFLQKIIDALNGTCSPILIGELYSYNMTMPCISPSDYIGVIWNIIDVICAGFFAYYFGKKLVVLFHNITSMKEGGLKEAYD